jgi:hypothetical protein
LLSIGKSGTSARNGQSCSAKLPRYGSTSLKPAALEVNPSGGARSGGSVGPAPLWWPLPAEGLSDDRRLLLLAELALGRPSLGHHRQHTWLESWPGWGMRRRTVTPVREQRGPDWALRGRDALAAPPERLPGSGSCGPARRPGPRRLGDGSAPAPRRAGVLELGHHYAGRPVADSSR